MTAVPQPAAFDRVRDLPDEREEAVALFRRALLASACGDEYAYRSQLNDVLRRYGLQLTKMTFRTAPPFVIEDDGA